MLMVLFSLFCFKCKQDKPTVKVKKSGTMGIVKQDCESCGGNSFTWRSQPYILGRFAAGNILMSLGILMTGVSISKTPLLDLQAAKHIGLAMFSSRTFFTLQSTFLIPSILCDWEVYRQGLMNQLKGNDNAVWSGDSRYDSMGHSAKYGTYTMFCNTISKLVHSELLQSNQSGSSNAMESDGTKRRFSFLSSEAKNQNIHHRHKWIDKWIREEQKDTAHYYDLWHVCRSMAYILTVRRPHDTDDMTKETLSAMCKAWHHQLSDKEQSFVVHTFETPEEKDDMRFTLDQAKTSWTEEHYTDEVKFLYMELMTLAAVRFGTWSRALKYTFSTCTDTFKPSIRTCMVRKYTYRPKETEVIFSVDSKQTSIKKDQIVITTEQHADIPSFHNNTPPIITIAWAKAKWRQAVVEFTLGQKLLPDVISTPDSLPDSLPVEMNHEASSPQLMADMGLSVTETKPPHHLVFAGSPGTGKATMGAAFASVYY
ncbi:hypothetical protein Bbelb_051840 [Branchiostoma belcheri]|nr:hypothetical protein Bbelb_051840 [Branchiostoma belcheri]